MKNLNPEFCRKAKVARKDAGLSQSELASEIGCKQSALSMFEQGDGTKLSDEVIEKIAKKFNLSITSGAAQQPAPIVQVAASSVRGFCPNPHCPSNHEYFVEEMRLFRPDREAAHHHRALSAACDERVLQYRGRRRGEGVRRVERY